MRVNHPDFQLISDRGKSGRPVVVFERSHYIKPTRLQRWSYRLRRAIVEALGGKMWRHEHQIVGESPRFVADDIREMREAVKRDLPGFEIVEDWNGINSHSYSISIQSRAEQFS